MPDGPADDHHRQRARLGARAGDARDRRRHWGPVTLTPGVRVELIDTWVRDRLEGREAQGAPQRVVIPGIGVYGALTPSLGLLAGVYRGFSPAAPATGHDRAARDQRQLRGGRALQPAPRLRARGDRLLQRLPEPDQHLHVASDCGAGQVDMQFDAGRAHIYGARALRARRGPGRPPATRMPVMAAYTYTRTELLETFRSQDPTLGKVEAGDELPFVPRHQASATVGVRDAGARRWRSRRPTSPRCASRPGRGRRRRTSRAPIASLISRRDGARAGRRPDGQVYVNVRNLLDAARHRGAAAVRCAAGRAALGPGGDANGASDDAVVPGLRRGARRAGGGGRARATDRARRPRRRRPCW